MLTDIRLTAVELDMLTRAANHVGAELVPAYPGEFRPADAHCLGLRATPGQLFRFGGVLTLVLDIGKELLGQLAARICEDKAVPGAAERVYYWPGILATGPQPEPLRVSQEHIREVLGP